MKKAFLNSEGHVKATWGIAMIVGVIVLSMGIGQGVAEQLDETFHWHALLGTAVYAGLLISLTALAHRYFYPGKPTGLEVPARRGARDFLTGGALGFLAQLLIFLCIAWVTADGFKFHPLDGASGTHTALSLLTALLSMLLISFAEEFATRSYLMTALLESGKKSLIIGFGALLFGMLHLLNPGTTFLSFLNTVLGGVAFALLFFQSGNLYLPFGFHFAWNFFMGDIFGLPVSGNPSTGIFSLQNSASGKGWALLTGGGYGPEGGLLATLCLVLVILYALFLLKRPEEEKPWPGEPLSSR